uniref:Uncharacterized protein n=1 Tax=viral metagenome TaxID=1070528 RepID=A0A6M3L0F9_9ZZZZ
MFASDWKLATLDYDRSATEFTGDDVDRFTDLVDLGDNYEYITVFIPALSASGTVAPWVQRDGLIATVPVVVHILDDDATGSFAHATSSGAGSVVVTFKIGGCRYLRIYVAADQTANRLFYLRGFNRVAYGT